MKEFILGVFTKLKQFITYGLVGCVNTLIDFVMFTLAGEVFGLGAGLSQAIGYSCGVISSFVLNHNITFRNGTRPFWQQALLFFSINVVSLVCSSLLIQLLHDAGMNRYLAKIIDIAIFTFFNFFAYKLVVFREKD